MRPERRTGNSAERHPTPLHTTVLSTGALPQPVEAWNRSLQWDAGLRRGPGSMIVLTEILLTHIESHPCGSATGAGLFRRWCSRGTWVVGQHPDPASCRPSAASRQEPRPARSQDGIVLSGKRRVATGEGLTRSPRWVGVLAPTRGQSGGGSAMSFPSKQRTWHLR